MSKELEIALDSLTIGSPEKDKYLHKLDYCREMENILYRIINDNNNNDI